MLSTNTITFPLWWWMLCNMFYAMFEWKTIEFYCCCFSEIRLINGNNNNNCLFSWNKTKKKIQSNLNSNLIESNELKKNSITIFQFSFQNRNKSIQINQIGDIINGLWSNIIHHHIRWSSSYKSSTTKQKWPTEKSFILFSCFFSHDLRNAKKFGHPKIWILHHLYFKNSDDNGHHQWLLLLWFWKKDVFKWLFFLATGFQESVWEQSLQPEPV